MAQDPSAEDNERVASTGEFRAIYFGPPEGPHGVMQIATPPKVRWTPVALQLSTVMRYIKERYGGS